ncbi:MAG: type IIL restriction-modification enzyme MmeI, partial [Croceibacterium sp.]
MTVEQLIAKWWGQKGGAERSNFATFVHDLCEALGLPRPSGVAEAGKLGTYEFEGSVPGGSFRSLKAGGSIDLYKRGCFIMEAKQSLLSEAQRRTPDLFDPAESAPRAPSGARYDKLMDGARAQAENYAKNLPGDHPPAPFIIVCDVGRAFEIEFDYTGNGRGYGFFPDKQSYRIELPDLAEVSKYLEEGITARGLSPGKRNEEIEEAFLFLMRVLFCMFAEDIGLLPAESFKGFLKRAESNDALFANGLRDLFEKMNNADPGNRFAHAIEAEVHYFNGKLFENSRTYPLGGFLVHNLYEAARQNWRKVEPAIFGTLLEQALSKEERAKLGA